MKLGTDVDKDIVISFCEGIYANGHCKGILVSMASGQYWTWNRERIVQNVLQA